MTCLATRVTIAPEYYDERWVLQKLDIGPSEAPGGRAYRLLFFPPNAAELCLTLQDFGNQGRLTLVTPVHSLWAYECYRCTRSHGYADDQDPPPAPGRLEISRTIGADWMRAFETDIGEVDLAGTGGPPWAIFGEALSIYREYRSPSGKLHVFPARHVDFTWAPGAYRFTAAIVNMAWAVFPDQPAAGFLRACTNRTEY